MKPTSALASLDLVNTCRRQPRRLHSAFSVLVSMVAILAALPALAAEYEASAVKAAFLHRFAAYVQWPSSSVKPGAPFLIAVLDDPAVASHLERLLPGLTIQNRRAQVASVARLDEARDAQILYIGGSQAARASALATSLKGQPILVVTGHDTGLTDGAAINFVQVGRNVRFEVSLRAARANSLQINSGLLSVAVRVEDEPRADGEGLRRIYLAAVPWIKRMMGG